MLTNFANEATVEVSLEVDVCMKAANRRALMLTRGVELTAGAAKVNRTFLTVNAFEWQAICNQI